MLTATQRSRVGKPTSTRLNDYLELEQSINILFDNWYSISAMFFFFIFVDIKKVERPRTPSTTSILS
jgi:hypothetical protein